MSVCADCGPGLFSYALAAGIFFVAPVGAFVLRKHIAGASGVGKVAGRALQALAAGSLPFALLLVLSLLG